MITTHEARAMASAKRPEVMVVCDMLLTHLDKPQ
jgi:hypothetical protein